MTGFDKVEIMMTLLPVFDYLTFWEYLTLFEFYRFFNVNRTFKTFLDDKRVASSLEKGRLFVKCSLAQRIFYLSGNPSSRKIQLYPNLWAWTKMKL